jgi:hypothetical protein
MSLDNAITQSVLIAEATVSILAEEVERLERRIEDAKQRLESLNGKHVGQTELYAVIEILTGNSPTNLESSE